MFWHVLTCFDMCVLTCVGTLMACLMLRVRTEHNSKLKFSFSVTRHCTWFINTCVYLWLPFITGAEKKTRTPDEQVNWTTAIHEAGHTIVGLETKTSAKNVYKVTIKSRRSNQSLGHVSVIGRVGYSMVSLECGTYFYTKKIILNMFPCLKYLWILKVEILKSCKLLHFAL